VGLAAHSGPELINEAPRVGQHGHDLHASHVYMGEAVTSELQTRHDSKCCYLAYSALRPALIKVAASFATCFALHASQWPLPAINNAQSPTFKGSKGAM
jgi:hypothetical protein